MKRAKLQPNLDETLNNYSTQMYFMSLRKLQGMPRVAHRVNKTTVLTSQPNAYWQQLAFGSKRGFR